MNWYEDQPLKVMAGTPRLWALPQAAIAPAMRPEADAQRFSHVRN
jgi:hypothetical protein